MLVSELIEIWEDAGGEARTSTGADGSTPDGPLIRFLMTCTDILRVPITAHIAKAQVAKRRYVLKTALNVNSVDEAYALIRSEDAAEG